jgi:hypothetical protein
MVGRRFGHDARMAMTATDFLDSLTAGVPESQPLVVEHLEDNDGLLLHLLTADLRRFATQSFDTGQSDVLEKLLAVLDVALREGTNDVQNAVSVSFVENSEWWDPATRPFVESWPAGLRGEVDRQRRTRQ